MSAIALSLGLGTGANAPAANRPSRLPPARHPASPERAVRESSGSAQARGPAARWASGLARMGGARVIRLLTRYSLVHGCYQVRMASGPELGRTTHGSSGARFGYGVRRGRVVYVAVVSGGEVRSAAVLRGDQRAAGVE